MFLVLGAPILYSTSTRAGEGAIYRYLSRQGKIAGDIQETKSSGLSISLVDPAPAEGFSLRPRGINSTKMGDGPFPGSMGYSHRAMVYIGLIFRFS